MPAIDELRPLHLELVMPRHEIGHTSTKPLIGTCRGDSDQGLHDYVLKVRNLQSRSKHPWAEGMARDLIGSVFARALGFTVPDYGIVEVGHRVARTADEKWRARLTASVGPVFGCKFLEEYPDAGPNTAVDDAEWGRVLDFDATIWNRDRSDWNPNLLDAGDHLVLIDHGLAIPTWQSRPSDPSEIWDCEDIAAHISFAHVQGGTVNFDLRDEWDRLPVTDILTMIEEELPVSWSDTADRHSWRSFLADRHSASMCLVDALATCTGTRAS